MKLTCAQYVALRERGYTPVPTEWELFLKDARLIGQDETCWKDDRGLFVFEPLEPARPDNPPLALEPHYIAFWEQSGTYVASLVRGLK
jgi:hypothetical protein